MGLSLNIKESSEQPRLNQLQQKSVLDFDALYCSEGNWEEEVREGCLQEQVEESFYSNGNRTNAFLNLIEQDLFWEDDELPDLLSKEEGNKLYDRLETNPGLAAARYEAVEWMLKVTAYYSFSALTAVLAVNYLDRFLFSFSFQREKPWMMQLATVACLSLAAKVEETQVPLLLDLQVEDSKYVFEAKTIQRMEILVLSTLQWRMNPITPLSFLNYMARRLGLKDLICWEFLRRCESILLCIILDSRFTGYLPSEMATATILHVLNGVEPNLRVEYQNQIFSMLGTDKDKVDDCCKLIMESAARSLSNQSHKRKLGSIPGSPDGVIDVSFSSDSSNDSWAVGPSVSSSPDSLRKKSKTQQDQLLQRINHAPADFLSISR